MPGDIFTEDVSGEQSAAENRFIFVYEVIPAIVETIVNIICVMPLQADRELTFQKKLFLYNSTIPKINGIKIGTLSVFSLSVLWCWIRDGLTAGPCYHGQDCNELKKGGLRFIDYDYVHSESV